MFELLAIIVAAILLHQLNQVRSRLDRVEGEAAKLRQLVARLRTQPDAPRPAAAHDLDPEGPAAPVTPPEVAAVAPPRPPIVAKPGSLAEAWLASAAPRPVEVPPVAARAAAAAPAAAPAVPLAATPAATVPPRRVTIPEPPPSAPSPPFDWEKVIGVKLFSWIAGAALAIAGVLFLRYSLDSGWLRPEVRMAIGMIVGVALLVVCEMKAARRYAQTANAMDAAGIALLFATTFASYALWHLIPAPAAFALLFLVTGVAVLLSIRRESMFIALLGLLGGFSTPILLSSGQDNPVGLFGYLLLLNGGLAWVAYKKRWPLLTALSMAFSTLYQIGWVAKFLTADKLPIAIGIFLLFPIFSMVALAIGTARGAPDAPDDDRPLYSAALFAQTARLSAVVPLLFALYLAAIPAYGSHFGILFGFLFLLSAGLFVVSVTQGPQALHALGALTTVATFAIWFQTSYSAAAYPGILGFVALFAAFYLAAPSLTARWREVTLEGIGGLAAFAAPLLLFVFPLLLAVEPLAAAPGLPFGVLFLLLGGCAAYAIRWRAGPVHYVAAFFAVAAEAVWSARYLDPSRLYAALGLYAVFGLFYVGVPFIARRRERPFTPTVAAGVLTLASLALLLFLAAGPAAAGALWGLALLIAVLNVGLFVESSTGRMPLLSVAGTALSWLVLAIWWHTAKAAAIVPALVVMGGFALLTMVGSAWARQRADADARAAEGFDANVFMGLIGHVFIAFVATRPELSLPPWPLLGALAVLDLAVLLVALYMRRGIIHVAACVATAVILMLWTSVAEVAPWPAVATIAAALFAALAFVAIPLARRVGARMDAFHLAAGAAVVLAQLVALFAQAQNGSPALSFLLGAQLLFITGALALSWIDAGRLGWFAVAAALPAGAAAALWQLYHTQPADWSSQLALSVPVLLLFVAYPLLLGRRAGQARAPYVATVLASVIFFFVARHSLMLGGYEGYIGALPIAQALLLVPVLWQLVRFARQSAARSPDRGGALASGRLALVAAATLACVTVAIPLQLDRNWITIGWAFEGAALLWLVRRIPHPALRASGTGLLVAAFVRLALNPAVLTYHARGAMPILNWYLYTYLLVAAALFLSTRLVAGAEKGESRLAGLFASGGAILLFLLLNIEIADFYATGPTVTFHFSANLAQDLTYTIGWALFALGLLAAGIMLRNKPCRIASIALLVGTVLKCFLHDLGRLGGLYRIGSILGLALCLALVAIVLQRFVLAPDEPRLKAA